MTLTEALSKISYALRGLDDEAPTVGSDEANYWVSVLNDKKDELYRDVKQNWSTAYEVQSLGTVAVSAAPTYNLPATFLAPSGDGEDDLNGSEAYIIKTDGKRYNLSLIKPEERTTSRAVFIAGRNPEKLYFTDAIITGESIVGGTLYLPGYYLPANVAAGADVLPVPDPSWLVLATAAEIAFNDIIYEDRAEGLNTKANNRYKLMVTRNHRGTHGKPRKVKYVVNPIPGVR